MTAKNTDMLQQISIIALCCTISYSIPKNNVFSWIVILLSAVCIILLAVKKEKYKIWCSMILVISVVKLVLNLPYIVPTVQELPAIAAMMTLLIKPSKKGSIITLIFVGAAVILITVSMILYDSTIIKNIFIVGFDFPTLTYYAKKLVFEWLAEFFACCIYPALISVLILKNNRQLKLQ